MAIEIQLFGQLKEITGVSVLMLEVADTDGLMKEMALRFPLIERLNCLVAVDRMIVQKNTPIKTGQELALLPPYSGG